MPAGEGQFTTTRPPSKLPSIHAASRQVTEKLCMPVIFSKLLLVDGGTQNHIFLAQRPHALGIPPYPLPAWSCDDSQGQSASRNPSIPEPADRPPPPAASTPSIGPQRRFSSGLGGPGTLVVTVRPPRPADSCSRASRRARTMSQAEAAVDARAQLLSNDTTLLPSPPSATDGGYRSQRKAAPSPLQSSITASSFDVTSRSGTRRAAGEQEPISPTSPKSPKEQLDDLLASERTFFSSSPETSPDPAPARPPAHASARSVSDSVVTSAPTVPATSRTMASAASHRANMARPPPRTSSIDSAISTISAGTNKSTENAPTAADIANLVQAAGSPEAVIQYLLKEKQSQSAQNAQLWRLVDKQRAMILGLNKDLERALKEKESYRKKLKESLARVATVPPVRPSPDTASESSAVKVAHIPANVSAGLGDSQPSSPQSPIDVALAPYPVTPPHSKEGHSPIPPNLVPASHKMPSPREHALGQFDAEAPVASEPAPAPQLAYDPSLPASRKLTAATTHQPPPPARKPPPAPLNLSVANDRRAVDDDASESDYEDLLDVDQIPQMERGRRKTREDDDRERELQAIRSAELRSVSKKSSKSALSPRASTFQDAAPAPQEPLPVNPRQAVPIAPPDAHLRQFNVGAAGSLAGILSGEQHVQTISAPLMSPGLPKSPRPMDRPMASPLPRNPRDGTVASPPLSPRMGGFPSVPLSPRAPRAPIPLPPNTPMSLASPMMPKEPTVPAPLPPPIAETRSMSPAESFGRQTPVEAGIFRGFVTEEYPDLLLPPNALLSIDVKVASSRLKPSRASLSHPHRLDEDPVFTLSVSSRIDGRELWRVEKDSASLTLLDHTLKQSPHFSARAPDRSLFSGHAPAKVDARRNALDRYLDDVLNTPLEQVLALELCRYLSTNAVAPRNDEPASTSSAGASPDRSGPGGRTVKSGYLTKKGKNFGGWKSRFFVLDGPVLKYYESPGGAHLGAIKLQTAQIGKQQKDSMPANETDDPDNEYRHAFLILEPKRKDSSSLVRHVLCAESDRERDQWVAALLQYVDYREEDEVRVSSRNGHHGGPKLRSTKGEFEDLRGFSYESTVQGEMPKGIARLSPHSSTPSPQEKDSHAAKFISAPTNAHIIQDAGAWGNKSSSLAVAEEKKQRKRSFFGFGTKPRSISELAEHSNDSSTNLAQPTDHGPVRPVFGAPLADAVRYNHPLGNDIALPAVVFRCIEYLDANNAAMEEGIFRLSGSNVVIKSLRERFNVEGDVNLVTDEQYYDIHAVASLLKLYLRELPTTVLTRELHLEFVAVTELGDAHEKVYALHGLVQRLPRVNHDLLRYLTGFLINIINHSDYNKMTVRNVGIVFSPTLNIPPPVFALFLQQYDAIFGEDQESAHPAVEVTVTAPDLSPDDIRSPRRQMFQELPTPRYDQQAFSLGGMSFAQPPQRVAYEAGFAPSQPAYDSSFGIDAVASEPSGGLRPYDASQAATKAKRRESSMFGMGQKKPAMNKHDPRMVEEESFFE